MIEFFEFKKTQQNFLNGKISQFIDAYIRLHKVWTPEQLHHDFLIEMENQIKSGYYLPDENRPITEDNLEYLESRLIAIKWLITENGKSLALARIFKKYKKDKSIANRKSPIQERIRFGIKKDKKKYFDISFGLKDSFKFHKTSELEKLKVLPWSIEHVNKELLEKYNCDIKHCLTILSNSHLEKIFVEYWKNHYYEKENPAIIPEVCGFRNQFYYYTYKDDVYTCKSEILEEIESNVSPVNFRYDFLILNFKKQKIAFIELDGFEYHKSRKQQTIDSIKRNNSSNNGVLLFTFTSKRIIEDIENVFKELDEYLK